MKLVRWYLGILRKVAGSSLLLLLWAVLSLGWAVLFAVLNRWDAAILEVVFSLLLMTVGLFKKEEE